MSTPRRRGTTAKVQQRSVDTLPKTRCDARSGLGIGYALAWMIHGFTWAARRACPTMPERERSTLPVETDA